VKRLTRRMSIKSFIIVWTTGLVLCCLVLALSLILSKNKLQSMSLKISVASKALDVSRRLNAIILEGRRDDLLWRATHDARYRHDRSDEMRDAGNLIQELYTYAAGSNEKKLITKVENSFELYKAAQTAHPDSIIEEASRTTDNLLQDVKALGDKSTKQVRDTLEASDRLNSLVDLWSILVSLFALIMATVGAIALVRRILPPTLALVRAAKKFGQGDFNVRIDNYRDDELGRLCHTFNQMAESITSLMKDRMNFVAAVAHDLKNALVVVGGAAHRLKRKLPALNEHGIWLDRIIEQAGYLDKLIQDLMDSARIETGELSLQLAEIDLTSFVRNFQEVHRETFASHRILFEGCGDCYVKVDKGRLERVFTNLISNAVKYSENGSSVLLKVDRFDEEALILVKDEGVGIDEDEIQKLFQPFKRLDRTKDMAKGTGLGLFSAKKIVEAHGGSINISSEPGNGTTVEIRLPVTRAA
jgi:two-component system sensor histidine kinase MtrB